MCFEVSLLDSQMNERSCLADQILEPVFSASAPRYLQSLRTREMPLLAPGSWLLAWGDRKPLS